MCGPGGIAVRFAEGMSLVADGTITAVASRSMDRATEFADRFGVAARYHRYEALCEDPNVDIVYVATPHSRHAADVTMYLEAGKHVLCEKPFALNAHQAHRMVDLARANGVFLMEAMWTRFLPAYRILHDLLAARRIGEPLLVEADFGFRVPVQAEHRLFAPALGGGALLDLGGTGVDEQVAALLHCTSASPRPDRRAS